MAACQHNVIRPSRVVVADIYPLDGAKAAHKIDIRDAVHAKEEEAARHPLLLIVVGMLLQENLHQGQRARSISAIWMVDVQKLLPYVADRCSVVCVQCKSGACSYCSKHRSKRKADSHHALMKRRCWRHSKSLFSAACHRIYLYAIGLLANGLPNQIASNECLSISPGGFAREMHLFDMLDSSM